MELKGQPRIIVVYGGGFQPFHMGHMSSYSQAKAAFPDADFYVAASNDTKTRPIPFDAKKFLAQQAGVVDDFVQVRQPINPQEIMQKYDATRDILVLVRSERDPMSYTKKDGSPGYYQPFVSVEDCVPFDQHGYIFVTKKHTFKVNGQEIYSGSQVREMYANADEGEQEAIIAQLYPDSDQLDKIKQIFDQYLSQQGVAEASSPAQQAAIAINMKKHHKKPKNKSMTEGPAQDEAEETNGWRAELVNQIKYNTFEVKMTNTRSKESANFIVRPVDMISIGPTLQIETMDVHDLQTGRTESWTSDDPQPDGGIVYAIAMMFWDNKELQKKLWTIVDQSKDQDLMPGLNQRRSIGQEVDADAYIDSQEKTQAAMAKMKKGPLKEFAPGPDGFGPFKIYIEEYYTGSSFATFDEAWDEVAFLRASDPKSATHNWRIVDGTGKTVWQYDIGDDIDNMRRGHKIQFIKPDDLKEFVPGGAGGSNSGRWYTDSELADIIGDDWFEDFDVSNDGFNMDARGEKAKKNLVGYANAWFDDRGYNVNVLGVEHNDVDHDLKWYIVGSFHNPGFAKKDVGEGGILSFMTPPKPKTNKTTPISAMRKEFEKEKSAEPADYTRTNDLPKTPRHVKTVRAESQGDSLKSNALSALMTVKQQIQQDRMAELEKWEQDFKNNVVSKFKSRWPDTKQPSASAPVAQPGEKHSELKAKLSQLNQAIEKQAMLDKLVQKLDSKGLLSPTIQAGVDTSLLVRDGARDNYVSLNQKLDKALDFVNNRLLTHKAAYAKPKSANMSENMDHSKDDQAVPELKSAMLDKKEKLQNASDDEVYDMIDTLMTRIAKSHGISGQKLHDMWVDKYEEIPDTWIMDENFADGRHPERKGLAKRSGVDTKASVSDLRKTARNSSGEKARMAHWLANMKAGRAKKSK